MISFKREPKLMRLKREEIRNKILETATTIFLENDFENSTMRDLAKKSGVSYGNIYKYFRSKEEILEALLSDFIYEFKKGFGQTIGHSSDDEGNSTEKIVKGLGSLSIREKKKFLIFFLKMKGSPLDKNRMDIIEKTAKHIETYIYDLPLAMILSENFYSTIANLALLHNSENTFSNSLEKFAQYHISGIKGIKN